MAHQFFTLVDNIGVSLTTKLEVLIMKTLEVYLDFLRYINQCNTTSWPGLE